MVKKINQETKKYIHTDPGELLFLSYPSLVVPPF